MNHTLYSADRCTHLKLVALALIADGSILTYSIAVRSKSDINTYAAQQNHQVIKAGKPTIVTNSETATIR